MLSSKSPEVLIALIVLGLATACGGTSTAALLTEERGVDGEVTPAVTANTSAVRLCRKSHRNTGNDRDDHHEWAFDSSGRLQRELERRSSETETETVYGGDPSAGVGTVTRRGPSGDSQLGYTEQIIDGAVVVIEDELDAWESDDPPFPENGKSYAYGDDGRVLTMTEEDARTTCLYDAGGRVRQMDFGVGSEYEVLAARIFVYGEGGLERIEEPQPESLPVTLIRRTPGAVSLEYHEQRGPDDLGPTLGTGTMTERCLDVFFGSCAPSLAPPPPSGERYVLPGL